MSLIPTNRIQSNSILTRAVSPNSSQGFWQVDSLSWSLGGQKKERTGNTTILDTGTTLLLVSDDVVEELYGVSSLPYTTHLSS